MTILDDFSNFFFELIFNMEDYLSHLIGFNTPDVQWMMGISPSDIGVGKLEKLLKI